MPPLTTKTYIDPPEGWKYGFPKVLPKGTTDILGWLLEQGYPQSLMESYGDAFHFKKWSDNGTPTYIDPPEGWKCGFPKVLPEGTTDILGWLVEQGYPKSLMESYGDHFHYRMWRNNDGETTDNNGTA